jgi:hypothetical protein
MNDVTDPAAVHRSSFTVHRLIHALWLGSGAFILLSASAIFRAAGTPSVAADVVGAMLSRWHYIGLLSPVLLLVLEWRKARGRVVALLFTAIVLASLQVVADVQIRAIRMLSPIPVSSRLRSDPVRQRFGLLHGISSLLLVAQVLAAAAVVINDSRQAD